MITPARRLTLLELFPLEETAPQPKTEPLPEEVFISLGVDTERIHSSIVLSPSSDQTTLYEAASNKLHVFKIPLDR